MAVSIFVPSAINFASGNDISQLEQLTPDMNYEDVSLYAGQGVFPGFTGSFSVDPTLDFTTTQIVDILDRCTVESVCKDFSGSNIELQWQRAENLKARYATTALQHAIMRATHSMLSWESISAPETGFAEITGKWQPISDGTNPPVTILTSQAIVTAGVQHAFKTGPVVLNTGGGATTLCVDSWAWANNLQYFKKRCSGGKYNEFVGVMRSAPTATVNYEDVAYILGVGLDGSALTSVDFYLRKLSQGTIEVAGATTEHIKISATVGAVKARTSHQIGLQLNSFSVDTTSALP